MSGYVLFEQKISSSAGGFTGPLDDHDRFASVAAVGDLDGDGVADLAVGASLDDDGGTDRGAVWILFLKPNGTVKASQKISSTQGGFTGALDDYDAFGRSVTAVGDLDGDGVTDLAVGAWKDNDGGLDRGAVWVLFLHANGTVREVQKISSSEGGFIGPLDRRDRFGTSVAGVGDLDADGVLDLAVGASGDDDGGANHGAVWVLFLNPNGTVKGSQKISSSQGEFTGVLDVADRFGSSVAGLGDVDGDGLMDLAVGAYYDDEGGLLRGAVWVLFLDGLGRVRLFQKISSAAGGFVGPLDDGDHFGSSVAGVGDLDGDGVVDLAVGAWGDDDGGSQRGAVWVLFLDGLGRVRFFQKISSVAGGLIGPLDDVDLFGFSVAALEDLDGDGLPELAVGAYLDDDGSTDRGAAWILFLDGAPPSP